MKSEGFIGLRKIKIMFGENNGTIESRLEIFSTPKRNFLVLKNYLNGTGYQEVN